MKKILAIVFSTILFLGVADLTNAKNCPIANTPCPMEKTSCSMEKNPCPMLQPCAEKDECPDVSSCPMVRKCAKRMQTIIGKTDEYSDQRFIRTIIMHKQVEIQVAQDSLQQIQDDKLKKEAQKLIKKDTKQIKELQTICRKIYGK